MGVEDDGGGVGDGNDVDIDGDVVAMMMLLMMMIVASICCVYFFSVLVWYYYDVVWFCHMI